MGQRHQLFVIAKIDKHYRSLCALHHQWLYGMSALKHCVQSMCIFSDPANRIGIQQELRLAQDFFKDKPAPKDPPPYENLQDLLPFPFITSCFMSGASYTSDDASVAVVHSMGYTLGFDQGDNNDGITVIDITDLDNLKYCFVNFQEPYDDAPEEEKARACPRYFPCSGWEYLLSYYPKNEKIVQDNLSIPELLDKKPLVTLEALAATWPWGKWDQHGLNEVPDDAPEQSNPVQGLLEKSTEKLVEAMLLSDDMADFQIFREQSQHIVNIRAVVKSMLLSKIPDIGKTNNSTTLLAYAYEGENYLDLSPYVNLDAFALGRTLGHAGLIESARCINISGIAALKSPVALWDSLSIAKNLQEIWILDLPNRTDDDTSTKLFNAFIASKTDLPLKKLVMSGLMSQSIREIPSFHPDASGASAYSKQFPVTQLLIHHNSDANELGQTPFEYAFLGDALLSPVKVADGILRFVETLVMMRFPTLGGTAYDLAACMARASTTIGHRKSGEVGLPVSQTCWFGKKARQSNMHHGCYPYMRDFIPGQWTAIVERNTSLTELQLGRSTDMGFRVCFLRPKVSILIGECVHDSINIEDLDYFTFEEFLRETTPGIDLGGLEIWKERLVVLARDGPLEGDPVTSKLEPLDRDSSLVLVKKFIDNAGSMKKTKDRARMFSRHEFG